jgi:hypothetical protein
MAYYSKLRPTVYHEYKNCSVGNNMVVGNLKKGRPPGAVLCETCRRLRAAGTGISGRPILPRPYKYAAVMAYYSKECPEIYHVCQNCHLGQNIEEKFLVEGMPNPVRGGDGKLKKPRVCKVCARLCRAGDCIPGAPIPAGKRKTTRAYYTTSSPRPKIYHVCRHCYLGKRIKQRNLGNGKPKKAKLCTYCNRMCTTGECILGAPIPPPARIGKPRPPTGKAKRPVSRPKPLPSRPKPSTSKAKPLPSRPKPRIRELVRAGK